MKLDARHGERQNVFAFIQSCYCARVRVYNLEAATASLAKLSPAEQHLLIAWVMLNDGTRVRHRLPMSA
jgi:hypothetical protein